MLMTTDGVQVLVEDLREELYYGCFSRTGFTNDQNRLIELDSLPHKYSQPPHLLRQNLELKVDLELRQRHLHEPICEKLAERLLNILPGDAARSSAHPEKYSTSIPTCAVSFP